VGGHQPASVTVSRGAVRATQAEANAINTDNQVTEALHAATKRQRAAAQQYSKGRHECCKYFALQALDRWTKDDEASTQGRDESRKLKAVGAE